MSDFSFEVKEILGTVGKPTASGWETKLTLVSWSGREPKYDIRSWSPDMDKMGKGISFTECELEDLQGILNNYFGGALGIEEPMTKEEMLAEMKEQV